MSTAVIGYMPMPAQFQYRALFLHGRPRHKKYDDFWRKHPPMDRTHRAKIFSAFDALAGFDAWITSKETPYCDRRILSEEERGELDRKLTTLRQLTYNSKAARRNRPQITVQYFSPCADENSFAYGTGGTYETMSGICKKVDDISGMLTIDGRSIPIDDIVSITGPLFDVPAEDIP